MTVQIALDMYSSMSRMAATAACHMFRTWHGFRAIYDCEQNVIVDSPGYIQQQEPDGSDKNVAHFRQVLQNHGNMARDRTSVARWLVKQTKQVSLAQHADIQGAHCECFPMYKDLCSANDQNSIAEWLVSTSVDTRRVGVLPSIEWEGLCCCIA